MDIYLKTTLFGLGGLAALFTLYKVWGYFFMKKLLKDKKGDDYYLNEHDAWRDD